MVLFSVNPDAFDRERAIFPEAVLEFHPRNAAEGVGQVGSVARRKDWRANPRVTFAKWMDTLHGSLATLRHGFKCYGRTLRVAFFKAAHGLNPELEERYAKNRVGIARQVSTFSRA